ncbi:sensor histidine kinase [Streptomyces flavofungini]|uniref:sensor histidine kinase n=1 Tax=Streptomyces flavofungini TaxID=68200 RepID=UPI0025B16CA1|nr:sensor histidine kinase [Streptomyces flavofungini]WJV51245.1 sensor histidine kinase [Streptomyces flavofungini]
MHSFGQPVLDRRQARVKLAWIGIWLVFLAGPVKDLIDGGHGVTATVLGSLGLTAFVGCYLTLVFRYTTRIREWGVVYVTLAALAVLAVVLAVGMGTSWLGLFVYVAVAAGAVLPMRRAVWAIPAVTLTMMAIGTRETDAADLFPGLGVTTLLVGFAMTGVRQLIRTTVELRQARATVAQLAANEERLRLSRDLHDLLGHSLSLITLKSELAGRMLPDHPDKAAQQVADIEQVSRQALVDVREAVTGYRRLTLAGQLAGARTALTAAGIEADVPLEVPGGDAAPDEEREAALAWALREAVTNVVRHSGAKHCAVTLTRRQTLAGPVLELAVEDDGVGPSEGAAGLPSGSGHGNGLTGLRERLDAVGGVLDVASGERAGAGAGSVFGGRRRHGGDRPGFRLAARVPLLPGPAEGAAPTALGSSA